MIFVLFLQTKTINSNSIVKNIRLLTSLIIAVFLLPGVSFAEKNTDANTEILYEEIGNINPSYPSYDVFAMSLKGYHKLNASGKLKKDIITVIDFSKSSNEKRLWVIDLNTRQVLFHDYVAHGRNSGNEFARKFSNLSQSHMSSIGFYLTGETYNGKHGLSLRLDGMDPDFNHNARSRAIVMHGADYVSEDFIKKYGRLGRSYGCPSVSVDISDQLIDTIREGSIMFIFYPDENYLKKSNLLHSVIVKS
jgi:hypothetical protein